MTKLDETYRIQRRRLTNVVVRAAVAAFVPHTPAEEGVQQITPIVEAGQRHVVSLVSAYMAAKSIAAAAETPPITLDPSSYTTAHLRGIDADEVYQRAYSVQNAALQRSGSSSQALESGRAQIASLTATDMQLAQTHAARDWMTQAPTIVGYRRVLTGPGPHCPLCELAATRTYRKADLMPIHEHCGCTVEPLWGTEPVTSVGTIVRVEHDPELGPRLMADNWSPVGPRLIN